MPSELPRLFISWRSRSSAPASRTASPAESGIGAEALCLRGRRARKEPLRVARGVLPSSRVDSPTPSDRDTDESLFVLPQVLIYVRN